MAGYEKRTVDELEKLYVEGVRRLINAGRLFDRGHYAEAPDIAKEVANFVYDHGSIKSLLTALGLKENMNFVCSATPPYVPEKGTLMSNEYYLVTAPIGFGGMDYIANKDRYPIKEVQFSEWWLGNVLSRFDSTIGGREYITRNDLVMHVRNNEGGGHVAAGHHLGTRGHKMARLMAGEYVDGHISLSGGEPLTAESNAPPYATLRQIGWELTLALEAARPDLWDRIAQPVTPGPRMKPVPKAQ